MPIKSVIIGFSGGVDSSTSAFLLKEQGYDVTGVTFIINNQWADENITSVQLSAKNLKIKHMFINAKDIFNQIIISDYIKSIQEGIMGSPCPLCNDIFKFPMLKQIADNQKIDYISTGHYAKIKEINNGYFIQKGIDPLKDQSYMLYRLNQEIKKRLLLPLGNYHKFEIRKIATDYQLTPATRPDSQGLCFAQSGYINFIKSQIGSQLKKGYFYLKDNTIIGLHNGYQLYTVGQRRGLGINCNTPLFITDIIASENKIILGDFNQLKNSKVKLINSIVHENYKEKITKKEYTVRPRNSSQGHPATILQENNDLIIKYKIPNSENAPGQHLVIYDEDIVVGGGIISSEKLSCPVQ